MDSYLTTISDSLSCAVVISWLNPSIKIIVTMRVPLTAVPTKMQGLPAEKRTSDVGNLDKCSDQQSYGKLLAWYSTAKWREKERQIAHGVLETYLGSCEKIHFQQPGLQVSFIRSVVLQGIQKERRASLDLVCFHEYVDNLSAKKQVWLMMSTILIHCN